MRTPSTVVSPCLIVAALSGCQTLAAITSDAEGTGFDVGGSPCPSGSVPKPGGGCTSAPDPATGCPGGSKSTLDGSACVPVGWTDCAPPFVADPSGWGCREVLPAEACAAGTMPSLGATECQAVGWSSCPAELPADPSGWGCTTSLPATSCSGATREAVGRATCQPVGSCNAPFPPAGATIFVDASYTAAELDDTHYKELDRAIYFAASGDVLAIDGGIYTVDLLLLDKELTLVGRCAGQVEVVSSGSNDPGLVIQDPVRVAARGLTLSGFDFGALVHSGGRLTLEEVVLDGNSSAGILADGQGATTTEVIVRRSVVRGTLPGVQSPNEGSGLKIQTGAVLEIEDSAVVGNNGAGINVAFANAAQQPARGRISRTVVRGTSAAQGLGVGVWADQHSQVELDTCIIADSQGLGLHVLGPNTTLTARRLVVRDTDPSTETDSGWGANVGLGAALSLSETALVNNYYGGVSTGDPDTVATLTDTVVRNSLPVNVPHLGRGVGLLGGAQVELTRTAIVGARGHALVIAQGSTATVTDSLVADVRTDADGSGGYGVNLQGAGELSMTGTAVLRAKSCGLRIAGDAVTAAVARSIVGETMPTPRYPSASGIEVQGGGQLEGSDSLISSNAGVGITLGRGNGVDRPSRGTFTRTIVRDTRPGLDGTGGRGADVIAAGDARFVDCMLTGNREAAIYASDFGSRVTVSGSVILDTLPAQDGIYGRGINVETQATVTVSNTAVVSDRELGLLALDHSQLSVSSSLVHTTTRGTVEPVLGHGLLAMAGSHVELNDVEVRASEVIGLAFDSSTAAVQSVLIAQNGIGLHVQGTSTLVQLATVPTVVGELEVAVSADTRFVDNQSRLGTGTIPLPDAAAPSQPPTEDQPL